MTTSDIYIVDDDDAVRISLEQLLQLRPRTSVRSFASGEAFLEVLPELTPGCVLLDLNMPEISGIGVLNALSPFSSRFAVVMMTAQGDIGSAVQAMKSGAIDFLEKPCSHTTLFTAIDMAQTRLQQVGAQAERMGAAQAKLAQLSSRQLEVLKGLIHGRSNKAIAFGLDISPRTVEIYRAKVMEKLEVRSLSEALGIAFAAGLFPAMASEGEAQETQAAG
ncbi:MAG TPA: response regulator [Sphingobium sp.]|uniref:response regulator transcription factor n=1 Tax=Sphingobium sp. TaxID=1912891 RepID=UPI002ED0988B